jgi:S-adenosylmethionine uptake transporter
MEFLRNRVSHMYAGVALAVAAWAVFSLQDAIVKYLVIALPAPEILFVRSGLIVAVAALGARRETLLAVTRRREGSVILARSIFLLAAWLSYYTAARSLQLAELVTLYFAAPLFVVAMSGPLLGEIVGPWRWLATALGFAGVVIAANPQGGAEAWPVALALIAAVCWAISTLLARALTATISTSAMMIGGNAIFFVICGAMAPALFVRPTLGETGLLIALGAVGSLGQALWIESLRKAQASLLAPLEYSMFAYAVMWGWLVFGDWPTARTLIGAAIILSAALLAIGVEQRRYRIARREA